MADPKKTAAAVLGLDEELEDGSEVLDDEDTDVTGASMALREAFDAVKSDDFGAFSTAMESLIDIKLAERD